MKKQIFFLASLAFLLWDCTDHDIESTRYALDDSSVVTWRGFLKTGYFNEGTIAVDSDDLTVREGQVTGGSFNIPVSSIINLNLPTEELKEQLTHHLQSPDFFHMALHPSVNFRITEVNPYTGTEEGAVTGANSLVRGMLTILGKEQMISFPARVTFNADKMDVEANAAFDRTLFGMTYASDPELPAENYIEPVIKVHLKLSGVKK